MRMLIAFLIGILPATFSATADETFDGKATSEKYYLVRGACRIGEDATTGRELTPTEMQEQCTILDDLGRQLRDHGYCWDKSELVWYACEQQAS